MHFGFLLFRTAALGSLVRDEVRPRRPVIPLGIARCAGKRRENDADSQGAVVPWIGRRRQRAAIDQLIVGRPEWMFRTSCRFCSA